MVKKVSLYLISFTLLILLNLGLITRLSSKYEKELASTKVLAEIEEAFNTTKQFNYSNAPFSSDGFKTETKLSDGRAANLKTFFRKHNSVLYDHAEFIVEISDKYGFDYRLLPAIAMQESTLCRAIPEDSHNCWGWGIYGKNVIRFANYEEAIETVAKGIKENYLDHGLTTASKIMAKYTPSSNGSWAFGVNSFLKALE